MMYVVFLATFNEIHCTCKSQIASLKIDGTLTTISSEYFNFVDIFFQELVGKLLKYTRIINHAINLVDSKQLFYRLIYCPRAME